MNKCVFCGKVGVHLCTEFDKMNLIANGIETVRAAIEELETRFPDYEFRKRSMAGGPCANAIVAYKRGDGSGNFRAVWRSRNAKGAI